MKLKSNFEDIEIDGCGKIEIPRLGLTIIIHPNAISVSPIKVSNPLDKNPIEMRVFNNTEKNFNADFITVRLAKENGGRK